MLFSYRTRRFLGRFFRVLLTLAVVALIALLCWVLWLQRFVVYTSEGVKLDFSVSQQIMQGQPAVPPTGGIQVEIQYGSDQEEKPEDPSQQLLSGCYISEEALYTDIPSVLAQLKKLPAGTPVLLDVKNYRGYFYYSTAVGSQTYGKVDVAAMDELIDWLGSSKLYAIARLPALSDYVYGAQNPSAGLPLSSGALYFDDNKCYWLDPTDEDTLSYLIQTVRELRSLGFEEVVFTDFRFPETDKIVFSDDRQQAISGAADAIVTACASDGFVVSYATERVDFPLPAEYSRLYLMNVAAADVADVASRIPDWVSPSRLVFFADNTDTRYNDYGVLRPVELANFEQ